MQLEMVGNTNVITGSCEYSWVGGLRPNGLAGGSRLSQANGTVTPDSSVVFTNVCYSERGVQDRYQYSENGTTATLRSTKRGEPGKIDSPWILSGTASGKQVEV